MVNDCLENIAGVLKNPAFQPFQSTFQTGKMDFLTEKLLVQMSFWHDWNH
jgi:hypothetical protein